MCHRVQSTSQEDVAILHSFLIFMYEWQSYLIISVTLFKYRQAKCLSLTELLSSIQFCGSKNKLHKLKLAAMCVSHRVFLSSDEKRIPQFSGLISPMFCTDSWKLQSREAHLPSNCREILFACVINVLVPWRISFSRQHIFLS